MPNNSHGSSGPINPPINGGISYANSSVDWANAPYGEMMLIINTICANMLPMLFDNQKISEDLLMHLCQLANQSLIQSSAVAAYAERTSKYAAGVQGEYQLGPLRAPVQAAEQALLQQYMNNRINTPMNLAKMQSHFSLEDNQDMRNAINRLLKNKSATLGTTFLNKYCDKDEHNVYKLKPTIDDKQLKRLLATMEKNSYGASLKSVQEQLSKLKSSEKFIDEIADKAVMEERIQIIKNANEELFSIQNQVKKNNPNQHSRSFKDLMTKLQDNNEHEVTTYTTHLDKLYEYKVHYPTDDKQLQVGINIIQDKQQDSKFLVIVKTDEDFNDKALKQCASDNGYYLPDELAQIAKTNKNKLIKEDIISKMENVLIEQMYIADTVKPNIIGNDASNYNQDIDLNNIEDDNSQYDKHEIININAGILAKQLNEACDTNLDFVAICSQHPQLSDRISENFKIKYEYAQNKDRPAIKTNKRYPGEDIIYKQSSMHVENNGKQIYVGHDAAGKIVNAKKSSVWTKDLVKEILFANNTHEKEQIIKQFIRTIEAQKLSPIRTESDTKEYAPILQDQEARQFILNKIDPLKYKALNTKFMLRLGSEITDDDWQELQKIFGNEPLLKECVNATNPKIIYSQFPAYIIREIKAQFEPTTNKDLYIKAIMNDTLKQCIIDIINKSDNLSIFQKSYSKKLTNDLSKSFQPGKDNEITNDDWQELQERIGNHPLFKEYIYTNKNNPQITYKKFLADMRLEITERFEPIIKMKKFSDVINSPENNTHYTETINANTWKPLVLKIITNHKNLSKFENMSDEYMTDDDWQELQNSIGNHPAFKEYMNTTNPQITYNEFMLEISDVASNIKQHQAKKYYDQFHDDTRTICDMIKKFYIVQHIVREHNEGVKKSIKTYEEFIKKQEQSLERSFQSTAAEISASLHGMSRYVDAIVKDREAFAQWWTSASHNMSRRINASVETFFASYNIINTKPVGELIFNIINSMVRTFQAG